MFSKKFTMVWFPITTELYVVNSSILGNITTLFAFYCQYNTGSREKIVMNKSQFIKFIRDIQYMKINNVMKNTNYELTWIKVVKATYTSHNPSQKGLLQFY